MLNCIIWGFEYEYTALAILKLQEEGSINIQEWIGEKCHRDFISRSISEYWHYNFYKERLECPIVNKEKWFPVFREIEKKLFVFADMFSRHRYMVWDLHECRHIFDILFWHFLDMIITKNVQVIIFCNIPHEGPDYILYSIAKQLGIKTILSYQSLFPNRHFCIENIENLGEIDHVVPQTEIDFIDKIIEEDLPPKEWDYMVDAGKKGTDVDIMHRLVDIMHRFSHEPWNIDSIYNLFWKGILEIKDHMYQNQLAQNCYEPTAKEKFIYFPLCLQPEMTTAAIGDIFCEQVRAIEILADKIKTELSFDCKIYVKENPKQTYFMRSHHFFNRLTSIDSVHLINPQVSTSTLIKDCICVATITGTAGYEAAFMNKSVMYFGHPWYKKLYGAFHYQTSLNEIINFIPDRQLSINTLIQILKSSRPGVVDAHYINQVYDSNDEAVEKNNLNIYNNFRTYLKSLESALHDEKKV
jgi:hypothetical protein